MNADHGMTHLAPDDAPEGITFADWHHGAQEAMAYRSFFDDRRPVQVTFTETPRIVGDRITARAHISAERPIGGARAWIAASTDRDFSLCTGIELDASAVMCRGEFLCRSHPSIAGRGCPGEPTSDCSLPSGTSSEARRYLAEHLQELNPLPTRRPSGHFCWWRELDGSGRDAATQCIDPLGVLPMWSLGDVLPTQALFREGRGTYADLPSVPTGADSVAALPPIYRYRRYGEQRAEAMLDRWGYVNPYERATDGEFVHWRSGYYVPRPVTVGADGTVELSWQIPAGEEVDHFSVTIEAWDEAGADGLPDVVYTPIITIDQDADDDRRTCDTR
ncbi:MAG TPA: hypothetical protein ENK57_04065 [Polyangiaceae bacterium]|nr:hypothetical protein [Polyangiaceae bacterium]